MHTHTRCVAADADTPAARHRAQPAVSIFAPSRAICARPFASNIVKKTRPQHARFRRRRRLTGCGVRFLFWGSAATTWSVRRAGATTTAGATRGATPVPKTERVLRASILACCCCCCLLKKKKGGTRGVVRRPQRTCTITGARDDLESMEISDSNDRLMSMCRVARLRGELRGERSKRRAHPGVEAADARTSRHQARLPPNLSASLSLC